MRVLAVNDYDEHGGAARAALRLSQGIRTAGVDLEMLVRKKAGDRHWQIRSPGKATKVRALFAPMIDRIPNLAYGKRPNASWSNNWLPTHNVQRTMANGYDLVHLHWIGSGLVSSGELARLKAPLVWTLHDTSAFTGGCHYLQGCTNFTHGCGSCPQLASRRGLDISRLNAHGKTRALEKCRLHIVCPSNWLANTARCSSILRSTPVTVIPNGIDTIKYSPVEKALARQQLGLPLDAKLIGFGAMGALADKRKGSDLLFSALSVMNMQVRHNHANVIFGASAPENAPAGGPPTFYLGQLRDDVSLRLLYSALDVVVVPSREENLSNVIMEAMACGTPVCAFDIGGNADMVDHGKTGYLARAESPEDLAVGISWILETPGLGVAARKRCLEEFDLARIARRYIELYETLVVAG